MPIIRDVLKPSASAILRASALQAIFLVLSVSLTHVACASQPATDEQASSSQIERESPLARVGVIGASASAGFLAMFADHPKPVGLNRAFGAVLAHPERTEISWHATAMFFTNAHQIGPALMDQALEDDPTLLIALDYLFWFGYGDLDHEGRRVRSEDQRLEMLEFGLAQLDRFDGPIVVGDFADMSPAIGLMLSARQVPEPATLERLNSRLREWAGARPDVIVMPLSEMVSEIQGGKGLEVGGRRWPAEVAKFFVVSDNLHPSPEGQVASATIIADLLAEHLEGVGEGDFDVDHDRVIGRLKTQDNP